MKKMFKILIVFLIIFAVLGVIRYRRQHQTIGPGPVEPIIPPIPPISKVFDVGYQIYDFKYQKADNSSRNLTLAIWYPTSDATKKYNYQNGRQDTVASVAVNGKVDKSKGPYPLLVFSHGAGACGTQSVFITKYLASQGYIVAAPDFGDSYLCGIKQDKNGSFISFARTVKKWGDALKQGQDPFNLWPDRIPDTKAVIDEMLALNKNQNSIFYQSIGENSIAAFGHSLGGWGTSVISGAVRAPYANYLDKRIKTALLLAPAIDPIIPEDFAKIKVPVMYLIGENDQDTNPLKDTENGLSRRIAYDKGLAPKYLGIIKQADHFSFADKECKDYSTVEACQMSNGQAQEILKYGLAFFDFYLKNNPQAGKQLQIKDSWFSEYEYEK